ncbi:MAG: site-specific integrase, partial [Rikenellaceae bacterium]
MASVKVKFRLSTIEGKEGTIYYQIIHDKVVRQINANYKIFSEEWDDYSSEVISLMMESRRGNYLNAIRSRIKHDCSRL